MIAETTINASGAVVFRAVADPKLDKASRGDTNVKPSPALKTPEVRYSVDFEHG